MTDSLFNVDALTPAAADASTPTGAGPSLTLYRKYRPQSFASDELFGQEHIVNTLRNAIRLDRIAHAYLFCGPRGTGKTTTARILAKAVNCLDPEPVQRPCNRCEACRAINANATTDVIEIDAASNRGIDDIRDLRERVRYAPTMLKTKFYIIDEAHQITGAAANAFLKTLEEPPPHTRFVLATTDPEELLQTIVSRCQRFDFRRINIEAMSARLRQVAEREGIWIDDESVAMVARHATGSLRDALGLLDQLAVYREGEGGESDAVTADLVRAVLGVSRNDRVEGMVRAIADRDPGAGLRIVNDAVEAGEDVRQLGRQFLGYLRILMLERASGSPDADAVARELASRFELPELARVARHFADIDYKTRHAAIAQLPLELAMIQASSPADPADAGASAGRAAADDTTSRESAASDTPPVARPRQGPSLKDRVRGAQMQRDSSSPPAASPAAPEREADEPVVATHRVSESEPDEARYAASPAMASGGGDLDRIVELWDNIRMDVKALNRRTEALLQQADPLSVDGAQLTLVAAYPFHQKRLNDDDTRKVIEGVIERQVGKRITVICVSRDDANSLSAPVPDSVAVPPVASPREQASTTSARDAVDDDDTDPDPAHRLEESPVDPDGGERPSPSAVSTLDLDEERIKAAINIFDATILDEND